MSLTVAFNQQSYYSANLCLQAFMSDTLAPDRHFIFVIAISNHLCCLLYLQQTRKVVMVVTIAPGKQACTNQQSKWLGASAACRYLTQGLFLFVLIHYTPEVFFVNFIYPSSWIFPHIDSKKVCGSFMLFCLVFAMHLCASVYMCLVVTCWERADLLALVCGV